MTAAPAIEPETPEETANEYLSVRLAEIEHIARIGTNVSSPIALELISVLRIYMGFAQEMNVRTVAMLEKIGGE